MEGKMYLHCLHSVSVDFVWGLSSCLCVPVGNKDNYGELCVGNIMFAAEQASWQCFY